MASAFRRAFGDSVECRGFAETKSEIVLDLATHTLEGTTPLRSEVGSSLRSGAWPDPDRYGSTAPPIVTVTMFEVCESALFSSSWREAVTVSVCGVPQKCAVKSHS